MESNTEFSNTAVTTGFLWWLLRIARRFLCCCGQDNSDVQLSVEETAPSSVSTVRPWHYGEGGGIISTV